MAGARAQPRWCFSNLDEYNHLVIDHRYSSNHAQCHAVSFRETAMRTCPSLRSDARHRLYVLPYPQRVSPGCSPSCYYQRNIIVRNVIVMRIIIVMWTAVTMRPRYTNSERFLSLLLGRLMTSGTWTSSCAACKLILQQIALSYMPRWTCSHNGLVATGIAAQRWCYKQSEATFPLEVGKILNIYLIKLALLRCTLWMRYNWCLDSIIKLDQYLQLPIYQHPCFLWILQELNLKRPFTKVLRNTSFA